MPYIRRNFVSRLPTQYEASYYTKTYYDQGMYYLSQNVLRVDQLSICSKFQKINLKKNSGIKVYMFVKLFKPSFVRFFVTMKR